jgi:uncharacterized membrane protein YqjE
MPDNSENGRSLTAIVEEIMRELAELVETRIAMLKSELREKTAQWRVAAPYAAFGVVMLGTSFVLMNLALVALVAMLIGNKPYCWVVAFLSVAVLWALVGGVSAFVGKQKFQQSGIVPNRTIETLKDDKTWLQNQARNRI